MTVARTHHGAGQPVRLQRLGLEVLPLCGGDDIHTHTRTHAHTRAHRHTQTHTQTHMHPSMSMCMQAPIHTSHNNNTPPPRRHRSVSPGNEENNSTHSTCTPRTTDRRTPFSQATRGLRELLFFCSHGGARDAVQDAGHRQHGTGRHKQVAWAVPILLVQLHTVPPAAHTHTHTHDTHAHTHTRARAYMAAQRIQEGTREGSG